MPRICVADCGSQLKALDNEKNPLFSGLKDLGIIIQAVAALHQHLNFSEWSYQEFKSLMQSMRKKTSKSIYDQGETLVEIQRKFNLCCSVIHCTPLLIKYSDSEECIVMKEALLKPYLAGEALDEGHPGRRQWCP